MGQKIELSSGSGTAKPLNLDIFLEQNCLSEKAVEPWGHDILDLSSQDI